VSRDIGLVAWQRTRTGLVAMQRARAAAHGSGWKGQCHVGLVLSRDTLMTRKHMLQSTQYI